MTTSTHSHKAWTDKGGHVKPTPRKRKRARPADGSVRRHRADHPHQVWAMDVQFEATADGRRLKFLESDRRAQPPLPGHLGGQAVQSQGRGGGAGGAHQPLPGTGLHAQ
jgi:hypothetical protein